MLSILLVIPFISAEYGRLPKSVLPIEYNLNLIFYFDGYGYEAPIDRKDTFDGVVSIALNITEPVDKIVLHSKNLIFTKNDCYIGLMNWRINITEIEYDFENEQVNLLLNRTLYASSQGAVLYIIYSGSISNDHEGIFKSTYVDEDNLEKPIISTHFEPIYAHRMVPCFDEPWMKAVWKVKITHPVGTRALSNMAEKYVKSFNTDMQTTIFLPTPLMSSYLLALTISDFPYVSDYSESGTLVRIFAPKNKLGDTKRAMESALNSLNFFENTFGIPYTLSKLDMFPTDNLDSGAMENWGLIIFRTDHLLEDKQRFSYIEETVAHEIAHQWFGNLVTMDWHSELWLNEAFATLYQTLDPDHRDFNYRYWYYFETNPALRSEKPIKIPKMSKKDLEIEAYVSHSKSSNVLAMLYQVIGPEKFEKGVSAYLKDNMYKAVNSTIFYSYLADSMPSGSPSISEFMDPWLEQVGIPFVDVENYNDTHYGITQKRFDNSVLDSYDVRLPYPKWNYTWYIPLWCVEDGQITLLWLKPGNSLVVSKNIKIHAGFFRMKNTDVFLGLIRLVHVTQVFEYTSLGYETFPNLLKFIKKDGGSLFASDRKLATKPLVSNLHSSARKTLNYTLFDDNLSKSEMEMYETTKKAGNLLKKLRDLDSGVQINSKFIIDNFDSLSQDEDLLFEVAKQSEGIGKTKLKELCENHRMRSVQIVLKQFEKLEEWRKNYTEKALAAVRLFLGIQRQKHF